MRIDARFNLMLHLCVLLGAMAFCVADEKPLLGLLGLGTTLACYLVSRGARAGKPPMLPRVAINLLVFAAIVNAAMRASGNNANEEFVSTLGQFLVFITVIKLLDRRAPRDDAQLVTLTIFIAVAAVLTAGSLPVGLLLMAYVPMVVATAMMWQIHSGMVLAAGANGDSALTAPVVMGRRPRRGFAAVCGVALLASGAIATGVFVLVPRGFGNDLLGRFGMTPQPTIGFRESVKLGESGFLSENPTPVMDVQLMTESGETLGGSGEMLYLRGAARDEYSPSKHVWEDGSAGKEGEVHSASVKLQEGYEQFLSLRSSRTRGAEVSGVLPTAQRKEKITMRGESLGGVMFSSWRPITVTPDRTVDARVSAQTLVMHAQGVGRMFTYTVKYSLADEVGDPPPPINYENGNIADFREGRIHDLAASVLAQKKVTPGAGTARQVVTTFRDYLRNNYSYTLEMVAPPGESDPIEFFLFERKKGHCEYFASAMAAMCQSQGIPCRVITGYLATEFNSLTGQYLVRESNAHAWVEAFIVSDEESGGGRWETFDASPPGDIERIHKPADGIIASLRRWYDTVEMGWSSSVVGYDNSGSQRAPSSRMIPDSAFVRRIDLAADRFATWIKTMRADPKLMPWWVKYSPLMLLVGVGVWVAGRARVKGWVQKRMRPSAREAYGMTPFRATGYYARTLKALERAGVPKPEQTPPVAFADVLENRSPEAATMLRSIAATFYRAQFGGKTLDAVELAGVVAEVERFERVLKETGIRA